MTEEITDAHSKEIWSMCLYADKKGFVTASADQTVKFWSFEALKVKLEFFLPNEIIYNDEQKLNFF